MAQEQIWSFGWPKALSRHTCRSLNGGRSLVFVARYGEPVGILDRVNDNGRRHHVLEGHALTKCTVGLLSREQLAALLRKLDCQTAVKTTRES